MLLFPAAIGETHNLLLDAIDGALVPDKKLFSGFSESIAVEPPQQCAVRKGTGTDVVGQRDKGIELILVEAHRHQIGDRLADVMALLKQEGISLLLGDPITYADRASGRIRNCPIANRRYSYWIQIRQEPTAFPFLDEFKACFGEVHREQENMLATV
jgi:hypothetical protein